MTTYPAPALRATVGGRVRCRWVSQGEQCALPMRAHVSPDGAERHLFARDIRAAETADRHARMAAIAAEGGERGAFFADLLADAIAREG